MTAQDLNDIRFATYQMCRIGLRGLIITLAAMVVASLLMITSSEAASLRSSATVTGDKVTLGDVFEDTLTPDVVLGAAPEPGKEMVLSAAVLNRVANNYKLAWSASSPTQQLVIKREAHMIDAAQMIDALKVSLAEKGLDGSFTISLAQTDASIVLPVTVEPSVEVGNLNFVPGRETFSATLAAPNAASPVKTLIVSGIINRMVQVPTLRTSARKGDIISAGDIAWVEMPMRSISKDTLLDADDIIGKTPSGLVASTRAIREKDVAYPQLVSRGDDVTIIYNIGGMSLTAKGKSQQNGSQGDLIRVTNLSSAKSMSASVTGDRTVTVQ